MGKSKQFKKLRREANEMPLLHRNQMVGIEKTGSELIQAGLKEVAGKEINPDLKYRGKIKQAFPVNHLKNMKKEYLKNGLQGVEAYKGAINAIAGQ